MARATRAFTAALIAVVCSTLPHGPASAAPVLDVDKSVAKVAGWSIGVSRSLAGCVAIATYQDQTSVWMGFDNDRDEAYLAFTNPRWRSIEPDHRYQLVVLTDRSRWKGAFVGVQRSDERGLFASGLKKEFVFGLARAGGLTVVFEQKSIARLSLSGSSEAISAALDCQKAYADAKTTPSDRPTAGNAAAGDVSPRKGSGSSGTGFFVSDAGHVLTNNHVVEGCSEIDIAKFGTPSVRARLVATDAENDLAVLSTGLEDATVPALSVRARIGESAYAYGFPLPSILAASGNFTVGNITAAAGMKDDTRMLQISTPIQPGNSGGPLIDQYGAVIGVINHKLNAMYVAAATKDIPQNVNFAIKSAIALNFLDANGIPPTTGTRSPTPLEPSAVAEKARLFTVHVTCR